MPESGAIERTRDAMNAWLHKDLPADFDQLRTDLRHILDCIPATHQRAPADVPDDTPPMVGDTVHFQSRGVNYCTAGIVTAANGDTIDMVIFDPALKAMFNVEADYYGGHMDEDGITYMPITWHHKH